MPTPNSRPLRETILMGVAQLISERGTCSRAKVGVVIANEGRILVSGYNGAPAGMPHCYHPTDEPCTTAVHGEASAISWAARHGVSVDGADLFTTLGPCLSCAQLIVNSGIKQVYYTSDYRTTEGVQFLKNSDVKAMRMKISD